MTFEFCLTGADFDLDADAELELVFAAVLVDSRLPSEVVVGGLGVLLTTPPSSVQGFVGSIGTEN